MAAYQYAGLTSAGRAVTGVMDAETPRAVHEQLRKTGIFPTRILIRGGERDAHQRISIADTLLLTQQWAVLLSSGVPLIEALAAIAEQAATPTLRRVCTGLRESIREGMSVHDALARYPNIFPIFYRQMVRAGEASGTLDQALKRLSETLETQERFKNQLISILTYPLLTFGISMLILGFLLAFVVPRMARIFTEMHQALPLPTRMLLAISDSLARFGSAGWIGVACVGLAAALAFRRARQTPAGHAQQDRWVLALPGIGAVLQGIALSRFARTFATLLSGGVPLLSAFDIARQATGNAAIAERLTEVSARIREGEGIAPPLKQSGLFSPFASCMIATGEKSGQLETLFERVSAYYDQEVHTRLTRAIALCSPLLILGLGGVVFFIVLSVLLPILNLSEGLR